MKLINEKMVEEASELVAYDQMADSLNDQAMQKVNGLVELLEELSGLENKYPSSMPLVNISREAQAALDKFKEG